MRRLTDIRYAALSFGLMSICYAFVPLMDMEDSSLFARVLHLSGMENYWIAVMLVIGAGLVIGSIFQARRILLLSESVGIFLFAGLFAMFRQHAAWTPVVIYLPVVSLVLYLILVKEVLVGLRRHQCRQRCLGVGISDLRA